MPGQVGPFKAKQGYCDGFHNTLPVHKLVSEECYRWMTPRPTIALSAGIEGQTLDLEWPGDGSPFLVLHCEDLQSGLWEGWVTYWTNLHYVLAKQHEFIRVIHLGQ